MGISLVFYTHDRKFAFQKVGIYYNLYNGLDGEFITEFISLDALCEYIKRSGDEL